MPSRPTPAIRSPRPVRVIGLDPSTSRTGVATVTGTTVSIAPRSAPADRGRRLHEIADRLRALLIAADVAVIEGYSLGGARGYSAAFTAEVGGMVRYLCFEQAVAVVEIAPTRLKLWAVGHGGSPKRRVTKVEMRQAAVAEGAHPANDDEADAWLLWHLGMVAYGNRTLAPGPTLAPRRRVLAAVDWPRPTAASTEYGHAGGAPS